MRRGVGSLLAGVLACSPFVDGDRYRFPTLPPDASVPDASAPPPPNVLQDTRRPEFDALATHTDAGLASGGLPVRPVDLGVSKDQGVVTRDDAGTSDGGADLGMPVDAGPDVGVPRPDGGVPDASLPDSGAMDLGVLPAVSIAPSELQEGEGVGVGVPVLISGLPFPAAATVAALDPRARVMPGSIRVGRNALGFLVAIPPDASLSGQGTASVTFRLSENGVPLAADVTLMVRGRDELRITGDRSLRASDLVPYSEVVIEAGHTLTVTGSASEGARLRASGRIRIAGTLRVDASGPGACPGGRSALDGGCGAEGGRGGATLPGRLGGGGGGGHADPGGSGSVVSGGRGAGGLSSTDVWLRDLDQAHGGGGGGGGGTIGGRGGDSGGTLLVASAGILEFSGRILAAGTSGGDGSCSAANATIGGAGGGGAGGSVILRGRSLPTPLSGVVDISGGVGGSGGLCGAFGGPGSRGRTRFDAPSGTSALIVTPTAGAADRVGVGFDPSGSPLQGSAALSIDVFGPPRELLPVWVDSRAVASIRVRPNGTGRSVLGGLAEGLHRVCVGVPGSLLTDEDGIVCKHYALVP